MNSIVCTVVSSKLRIEIPFAFYRVRNMHYIIFSLQLIHLKHNPYYYYDWHLSSDSSLNLIESHYDQWSINELALFCGFRAHLRKCLRWTRESPFHFEYEKELFCCITHSRVRATNACISNDIMGCDAAVRLLPVVLYFAPKKMRKRKSRTLTAHLLMTNMEIAHATLSVSLSSERVHDVQWTQRKCTVCNFIERASMRGNCACVSAYCIIAV